MSSTAATQSDGYYIPPSYIESGDYKKKSVSQHAGSKGTNQSQLYGVVRFELPIKSVCTHCNYVIGKGTRFNAKKDTVGAYFSSKIYSFTFKCYECKGKLVMQTNPKNADYDFISGIRRKVQAFDTKEAGSMGYFDTNDISQLKDKTSDPMGRLERDERQKQKQVSANARVEGLISLSSRDYLEDYSNNSALRKSFRSDRKVREKRKLEGAKAGLAVPMVDERADDIKMAKTTKFLGGDRKSKEDEKRRMKKVRSGGIFGSKDGGGDGKKKKRRVVSRGSTVTGSITSGTATSTSTRTKIPKVKSVKRPKKPPKTEAAATVLSALADYGSSDSDA